MHTKNLGGHASRKSRVNELAKKFEVYASDEPLSIRPPSSNSTLTDTPNKLKNTSAASENSGDQETSDNNQESESVCVSQAEAYLNAERNLISPPTSEETGGQPSRTQSIESLDEKYINNETAMKKESIEQVSNQIVNRVVIQKNAEFSVEYVNNKTNNGRAMLPSQIQLDTNEVVEIFKLKNELNILRTENDILKMNLQECQYNFRQFQSEYRVREKLVNEEIKNLRKKVLYLMKKSVVMSYTTDNEEPEAEERIISF